MEPSASRSEDIRGCARKVRKSGSRADNTGVRFSLSLFGRWLPVVALTAVGAAAAASYAYTAVDRYQATAQLIVSPVSASDPTYLGLGLLRDTGGKRTAAASVAVMLRSPQVADAVRTELGLTQSRDSLLRALHAHAVGPSDIVDVTVEDNSPVRAAQLANAFANALVSQRTASFQSQLTTAIRRADEELLALPPNQRSIGAGADILRRLVVLRSLQGQPDPTIRPADQAEAPTAAIWPQRPLLVAIGAGAGVGVGLLVFGLLTLMWRRPRTNAPPKDARAPAVAVVAPPDLSEREHKLEERDTAVAAREHQADTRAEELHRRTTELEERAHLLERRTAELESRTEARSAEVETETRERAVRLEAEARAAEARAAEARAREAEARAAEAQAHEAAEREAAERAAQDREAAERAAALREAEEREAAERAAAEREAAEREATERAAQEQEAAARAAQPAPPEPALPGVPLYRADAAPTNGSARGHWNLTDLERLVDERGREFPERIDEWASYLFFLRDYAEPDGSVPASFDWLIEDEFAELV
jgi:capsular polysaccharide biosynthesis protein